MEVILTSTDNMKGNKIWYMMKPLVSSHTNGSDYSNPVINARTNSWRDTRKLAVVSKSTEHILSMSAVTSMSIKECKLIPNVIRKRTYEISYHIKNKF